MFECWHFVPFPPSVLSRSTALFFALVSAFSGKQPRGSSFDRLVPNLPPADFIKHALSVQCTCACHGVHRADTNSVLRRASTSTGVLRACVFSICRTFCKLQQGVAFSPCRAHRLHLHLWWSTSRRHQQFMLHLRLSLCTSRGHKWCLMPRKHKYWSTSRLRLQHMPDILQTATGSFHSLPVVPTVYTCTCGGAHSAGKHFRQIGIGLNLIMVVWCRNSGSPFWAAACVQGCARLPMATCALLHSICSFPCSTIKMIITV